MKISEQDIEKTIQSIRRSLRLSMDGVISTSMRRKGFDYSINFGVPIPTLRKIAQRYQKNAALALALWKKNVRELKILGTLLFPTEDCSRMLAKKMATDIVNQEIREQLCMNLLQNISFAHELAEDWIQHADSTFRMTGYWLFARLSIIKSSLVKAVDIDVLKRNAFEDAKSEDVFLQNAALLALKHLGRNFWEKRPEILTFFADNAALYDALKFEFEFYA